MAKAEEGTAESQSKGPEGMSGAQAKEKRRRKGGECLLEPRSFHVKSGAFELSFHRPTRMLERELDHVFPSTLPSSSGSDVIVIPTAQQACTDLLGLTLQVAQEKDRLLDRFGALCKDLRRALQVSGFWFDYCDPASGLPMFEDGGAVFSDVECFERLRKYKASQAGGCKVVFHPKWGSSFYPSTMFTNCPPDQFVKVLESLQVEENAAT